MKNTVRKILVPFKFLVSNNANPNARILIDATDTTAKPMVNQKDDKKDSSLNTSI